MYTDLEKSSIQYRTLCGILASIDLTRPDAPAAIKPETQALLDQFSKADWDLFVRMAKTEGVAPLMHHAVSRSAFSPPEVVRQKFQAAYYESAAYNQLIFAEMERLVQALTEVNIPVIVLKGAALATTIYPNPALRPMNDLDLLVAAPCVGKAVRLLRSLGFNLLKITNHAVLHSEAASNVSVELHWMLPGNRRITKEDTIQLVNEITEQPISSDSRLSFELLYLCAHLVLQHDERRLIWFFDIFTFLRCYQKKLDLNSMFVLANRLEWAAALSFVMQAIHDQFGFQLPDNIKVNLTDTIYKPSEVKTGSVQSTITSAFLSLGFFDRLWMALSFIFPSPKYLKWRYHSSQSQPLPFLYFHRWCDLVKGDLNGE